MADESSHELEHSPTWKAATVKEVTLPSHKSEAPPLPVDTSSQASMEEAESSLKGIPANVSPCCHCLQQQQCSPSTDPTELQTSTSIAANHMLHVKRSTDLKRQQWIWELGLLMCQSEVKETTSITKAKVIHS